MVVIPTLFFAVAENARFQTYITKKILVSLSEKVGTEVTIGRAKMNLFRDLVLEEILIRDKAGDSLVYIPKLKVDVDSVNIPQKRLIFKDFGIYDARFHVKQHNDSVFNFQFLLDSLASKDTVNQVQWVVHPGKIRMYKSALRYQTPHPKWNMREDIRLNNLNLHLNLESLEKDSMVFNLKRLSFEEPNGYQVESLKSDFTYTPNQLTVNDFELKTAHSEIVFKDVFIQGDSIFASTRNFENANASYTIKSSEIGLRDLAFLNARFTNNEYRMAVSGSITGKVQDLNLNNVRFAIKDVAFLDFSAKINNLLDADESFLFAEFNQLHINSPRFTRMLSSLHIEKPALYRRLNELGKIDFSGDITGLPGNYVAFGTFKTRLGTIKTDISLQSDYNQLLEFRGNVKTTNFNMAALTNDRKLFGRVSMDISVDGLIENAAFQGMTIDGFIEKFEFKDYAYTHTDLHGYFGHNMFNGAISMNDPNLNFMFYGRVDFSKEVPVLNFDADIKTARVGQLNLLKDFPKADLSCQFAANVVGNSFSTFNGEFTMHDFRFSNRKGAFKLDSVRLDFMPDRAIPAILLSSNIAHGSIEGKYQFSDLINSLKDVADNYVPAMNKRGTSPVYRTSNNFNFACKIDPVDTIAYILDLPYYFYDGLEISGMLNDSLDMFDMAVDAPISDLNGALVKELSVRVQNKNKNLLKVSAKATEIQLSEARRVENFSFTSSLQNNLIDSRLIWNNNQLITNSGNISTRVRMSRSKRNKLVTNIHFNPSSIILADSQWVIPESDISISEKRLQFKQVQISNQDHFFNIDGIASQSLNDSLTFSINNIDIQYIEQLLKPNNISFSGHLNGKTTINGLLGKPLIKAAISIDSLTFNREFYGLFDISSIWNDQKKWLDVNVQNRHEGKTPLLASGIYSPQNDSLDINIALNQFSAEFLRPFIDHLMKDVTGYGSGNVKFKGSIIKPYFEGKILLEEASLGIDYLKTRYHFSDSVEVGEHTIVFDNVTFYDHLNNPGSFSGTLGHTSFKNMSVDLDVSSNNINVLNLTKKDNDLFYGEIYGGGTVDIVGANGDVTIEANMTSRPNSTFVLPITSNYSASENNFINYKTTVVKEPEQRKYRKVKENNVVTNGALTVILGISTTPDVKVEMIFDETVGDIIKGQGSGQLNFIYSTKGDFSLNGEYKISKGDYLFTLQNLINKSFNIEPGGIIRWTGDPFAADLDLDAYYPTRAPLYDLMPNSPNAEDLKKRFPVQCHMMLTNDLMNPTINFDIVLPTADDETKRSVESVINSDDELNRQVLSLLVMNRFYTPDYMRNTQDASAGYSQSQAAAVTASEFLSNQLSNWLSQISNEVDLGVHYRPGDNQITSTEVELALSSQLFDDRVEFNGNVGYRDNTNVTTTNNPSNFVGDFEVFVKLNQQYRLKAYSRTNDNIYYETSPTTQGVGIIYREEFDNLQDLAEMQRNRRKERKQKRQEKRMEKRHETPLPNADEEENDITQEDEK